ncbi:NADPH-dependent FMN reductase [Oenococcus kitaharae]|uniref:NADPH-dependent FMN reductase n=1 Tax=Oenococcus kitaharae DSM 17330 TaxID=1045004 RepID=G9WG83_9LACO|nr:NAD(P)H-dependent oxidoreductase [Oenococcus kitaharae]EHN59691.1 NADPH-dependent FMN reductase [Oenococcus kitaharae DSM 17330]OEY83525.1 NADPH-dependent FMN reductase [Oenococcus kitaharae]OEY85324.1 NADPH-dependent FMN reductase [Oenococcus kitaharae]OEY86178.1 NADPH-dependent FMN reductase [Oenococcus kitaharae]
MTKKIALIVGSLRKKSYTRAVGTQAAALLPKGFELVDMKISDLALYNQDFDDENQVPESWQRFRKQMADIDAVIFATPEYNRSMPAALKNALDVGSRPVGQSIWNGKPALIISVSPGNISGFGANHHLRQSLVFLNMPVVAQPEVYIGKVRDLLDDNLKIINPGTTAFLQTAINTFVDLVKRFS